MPNRRYLIAILLLLPLVLAACAGDSGPRRGFIEEGRLLVWQGDGPSPDQKSPGTTGTVGYLNSDGTVETLVEVPAEAAGVSACGNGATSPNGQSFAFHVNVPAGGTDGGTLYLVNGSGEAQLVRENIESLACTGNGTFQFSPDSSRFAFIAYDPLDQNDEYTAGNLYIYNANPVEEIRGFRGVTAYVIGAQANAEGFSDAEKVTAFISLFTNTSGAADEAAVYVWDGQSHNEITTLFPERGCRFTSGQLAALTGTRLTAVMGQRCSSGNSGTSWHLYTIDTAARTATKLLADFQPGGFFPNTRTNNIYTTANANGIIFTQADGIAQNTVTMRYVDLDNPNTENVLVERGGVMPRYESRRFVLPPNAPPVLSPDGRWLALVSSTGTANTQLVIIDLNAPDLAPTTVPTPDRNDSVIELLFTQDSRTLYYVTGGVAGTENSIFRLNLTEMTEQRLVADRFGHAVVSPDANRITITQYKRTTTERPATYTDLVMVEGEGEPLIIFEGVEVGEGENPTITRTFTYPLSWRP